MSTFSVIYVECDVPSDMTLRQWRRARTAAARTSHRRRHGLREAGRRIVQPTAAPRPGR